MRVWEVGYDPEITGELSASDLDALLGPFADRPVRLAHRSGHAWLLNRQARAQLGLGPGGLLLDDDDRIRAELGGEVPLLAHVSRRLARAGVTGVTDAGVHNGAAELAALRAASGRGELLQRCLVLGGEELPRADDDSLVGTGALKIVLAEHDLPGLDDLVDRIARAGPRLVAVHTVTLPTLVLALAALASPRAGGRLGHRLEHAAVAPPDLVQEGRRLGVRVVTQPAFVLRHGDRYHRTVEAQDRPWLYRLRGWREAGVPLAAGSDAPYGPEDPWISMRAAVERRTGGGAVLGQAEALSPEEALALFTSPARAPGSTRPLRVGDVADLCLLSLPWSQARQVLDAGTVRASVVAGRLAYLDATQR